MLLKLWQHLRLPFSFYLMPVYFFALSISPNFTGDRLLWSFLLIHFFLLPSSHSLASRVEDRSSSAVVVISVVIGIIALAGGFSKVGALFSLLMLIYLLISYFSALTQLKVSANAMLYVLLFIISYTGINEFSMEQALQPSVLIPALLMSFLLMAPFPLIHYREQSAKQMRAAIQLTLVLTTVGAAAMEYYFYRQFTWNTVLVFFLSICPVLIFLFGWWIISPRLNTLHNFFRHLHIIIISVILNGFFIWFFIRNTHIDQLFQ
jgi:hypothetical protein